MHVTAFFAIPGDLATLTGGYGYDRRVLAEAGGRLRHLRLPGDFPFPSPSSVAETLSRLRAAPREAALLVDGLAYGALPADELAAIANPIVALVHHPIGLETGLDAPTSQRLIASERAALARADAIVVTSETTRDTLIAGFGAPPERIAVAEPGVDPARRARGSGATSPRLLAVGTLAPRKGYHILIEALAGLRELDWRLWIVGAADRAPECAAELRAQVRAATLGDRVAFAGEMWPGELATQYDQTDLFVMSSFYEGYGMVLAEAMARGLPIVTTTGGAAARTVPDGAALKVPPGDAAALADALSRAIGDPGLRARLGENSWRAGQSLPRWSDCAATILAAIDRAMAARG